MGPKVPGLWNILLMSQNPPNVNASATHWALGLFAICHHLENCQIPSAKKMCLKKCPKKCPKNVSQKSINKKWPKKMSQKSVKKVTQKVSQKMSWTSQLQSLWYRCYCAILAGFLYKTSQELWMLSSVTINCQITKIVMNSGSQLSEL